MKAWAALGLAVMAACDGRPNRPLPSGQASATSVVSLRGVLLVRDSSLRLVACGTTVERPVRPDPASQLLVALVAINGAVRDSMFVELVADTTGGGVIAHETRYATSLVDGSHCDRARASFDVEAFGTEPFWHLTLDSVQLVLERPERPLELAFVASSPETRGALTTIRARREEGRVRELKLGLLHESCRDGMGDAWYPYRAEVRFGTTALHGCARR